MRATGGVEGSGRTADDDHVGVAAHGTEAELSCHGSTSLAGWWAWSWPWSTAWWWPWYSVLDPAEAVEAVVEAVVAEVPSSELSVAVVATAWSWSPGGR